MEPDLVRAIHAEPRDDIAWLALADWLEERSDPRSELVRLSVSLRREDPGPQRTAQEGRLRELIAGGVDPCVPVLVNSVGMEMVLVPPGRFRMGSPPGEMYHSHDEGPVHEVTITRAFYLGRFPVTQAEYQQATGLSPCYFSSTGPLAAYRLPELDTARFPADSVSFESARHFCRRLSELPAEQAARRAYRLPSEAEWEYACRAGTSSVFSCGDSLGSHQANFDGHYPYGRASRHVYLKRPCAVGSYRPNGFGLYDMHGNVWEWCSDWFGEPYYQRSPASDPRGPERGSDHVLRGGSWIDAGWHCRSADRSHREALHYVGFRVAMDVQ